MSFVLRGPRIDVNLGSSFEFLGFCRVLGDFCTANKCDRRFRTLLNLINTNEEKQPLKYLVKVKAEATRLLKESDFAPHPRWILTQLSLMRVQGPVSDSDFVKPNYCPASHRWKNSPPSGLMGLGEEALGCAESRVGALRAKKKEPPKAELQATPEGSS